MDELQFFAYHGKHGNKFVSFDKDELNQHPRLTTDEVFRTSYVDRVIDESTQSGQVKTSGQFQINSASVSSDGKTINASIAVLD